MAHVLICVSTNPNFKNPFSISEQEVASNKELDLSRGNVEEELKVMVQEALRKNDTKDVVSKISSLLLEDKDQGREDNEISKKNLPRHWLFPSGILQLNTGESKSVSIFFLLVSS